MTGRVERSLYRHQDLKNDEIRLVQLLPGNFSDTPRIGNVIHRSLGENPSYEAISYVWGDLSRTWKVSCGEGEYLEVSLNAFLALKHLQLTSEVRTLWLDSICINQNKDKKSTEERGRQVQMMGQIFSQALRVVIHLGLRLFSEGEGSRLLQSIESDSEDSECKRLLTKICGLPYFTRTWTIQEALLAKEVSILIANTLIPLRDLLRATERVRPKILDRMPIAEIERSRSRGQEMTLLDLLRASVESKATVPRDRIYALLGLVTDKSRRSYPVDYTQTNGEVSSHYTAIFFQDSKSMDLFLYPPQPADGLPTWAIDWSCDWPRMKGNTYFWPASDKVSSNAGHPLEASYDIADPLTLSVQGIKVDEINSAGSSYTLETHSFSDEYDTKVYPEKLRLGLGRGEDAQSSPAKILETYFCTLICEPGYYEKEVSEIIHDYLSTCPPGRKDISWSGIWSRMSEGLRKSIDDKCEGNRLFTTDNGYSGLGDSRLQIGDLVCILTGSSFPFVLRPTDGEAGKFHIISRCYVHGIMSGELMRDLKPEDMKGFRLC